MSLKNIKDDFNLNKSDIPFLSFLAIFNLLILIIAINFNESIGIYCSDVFVYLLNSLNFAGINVGATKTMFLSPIICYLTSLLFKIGFVDKLAIFIVTGLIGIIGNFGIYILLKNRFNSLFSFTGAILFGSFSLNLLWLANGTLDVPAVALSIWVMVFGIIAIDKNPKFYLLAIPLLVIAFFTRYTVGFIFPLFFLYYLSKHDFFNLIYLFFIDKKQFKINVFNYLKSEEFKYILIAIGLAVLIAWILIRTIIGFGSPLSFLGQTSSAVAGSKGSVVDNAYTTDMLFYVHDFLNFLFAGKISYVHGNPYFANSTVVAYLVLAICFIGLFIATLRFFRTNNFNNLLNSSVDDNNYGDKWNNTKINKNSYFKYSKILKLILIISLAISIIGFKFSSMIFIAFFLIAMVSLMSLLKVYGFNENSYYLNILFVSWFVIYFGFFTFLDIKVNRYIITALPGFVYLVIFGLDIICQMIKDLKLSYSFKLANFLPMLMILMFLISAFSFYGAVDFHQDNSSPELMADYLIHYDSNYDDKKVAVYNKRSFSWFLKSYVIAMPDDKLDFLDSSNIDYYISDTSVNLTNYTEIHKINNIYLYQRN